MEAIRNIMDINAWHLPHPKELTQREIEVLQWSAEGKTAADIAIILSLKERTINFHVASAILKMGATNKTAAVARAVKSGVIQLDL
ncbi:helix-turn-helix transcriptional regulator [Pseudomonas sp. DOAB1067]|uniref:Helix-turn-helix transcriptional regulator n=2 Tax=Pseudomonas triticifolii TaxID=2762592 RepID=A0ABR7BLA1_9PSED|nr:helix-turn-helix transcriptional regulator [Pseudomonas triticifolii]